MIKIAYIINNLGIGGAERLLLETIKFLDKSSFDVTVYYLLPKEDLLAEFHEAGIRTKCLNMSSKRDPRGFFRLVWELRAGRFSIVHTNLSEADVIGRFAAIVARVPVILSTDHTIDSWKLKQNRLKTHLRFRLNRLATRFSKGIIAVAQDVKNHLVTVERIPAAKIRIITNGISIPPAASIRGSEPAAGEQTILGVAARLFPEKGHEYLLRALKDAISEFQSLHLRIAGDGPLRNALEALVAELDVATHVEFLGTVNDMNSFYKGLDIFVLPSVQEGLPLALLEAMSFGKPTIATRVGAVPEVLNSADIGLLAVPRNVEQLTVAILALARDQKRRKKMGQRARTRVLEQFSLDKAVSELEGLYNELLAGATIDVKI